MPGGTEEPGAEGARIAQAPDAAIDREPDFLLHVFGRIAHQAGQVAQGSGAVPVQQEYEGALVTRLAPEDQEVQLQPVRTHQLTRHGVSPRSLQVPS